MVQYHFITVMINAGIGLCCLQHTKIAHFVVISAHGSHRESAIVELQPDPFKLLLQY
jgi:hypothetical protein